MTVYGDLDVSVLDELPPGRTPINTEWARDDAAEDGVWDVVRAEVGAGRQVYVVCPLIDESEALDVRSAEDTFAALQAAELSDLRLGLLHGRVTAAEKASVMDDFRAGDLDVLVATTVIEVGVDVPNATVMVILDADRFGIAQLHQLRGRVVEASTPAAASSSGIPRPLMARRDSRHSLRQPTVSSSPKLISTCAAKARSWVSGKRDGTISSLRRFVGIRWVAAARQVAIEIIDTDEELDRHPGLADELELLLGDDDADYLMKD